MIFCKFRRTVDDRSRGRHLEVEAAEEAWEGIQQRLSCCEPFGVRAYEQHQRLRGHLIELSNRGHDRLVRPSEILLLVVGHEPRHEVRAGLELGLGPK